MLRSLGLTAALLALATTWAIAAEHSDTANNFRISAPEGWTPDTPINANIKFKILSPRFDQTRGVCTVFTTLNPSSRALTQADIDADGDARIDENFWLTSLKKAKSIKEVTVESHGQKMVNGHKAYFVVAQLTGTVEGVGDVSIKIQQMMEAIPGQFFLVGCAARNADDGYPVEESDFTSVLHSFAPLSDAPVASLSVPGVSSLTMYSQPRFGGVSRVVTQDAPDLAAFGWRGPTASMSVADTGAWEVCDGANYTGRCAVVSGANLAHGGGVASARRAQMRGLQDEVAAALADAFAHAH